MELSFTTQFYMDSDYMCESSQSELWMYAAFVGMGSSAFSVAAGPGCGAVPPLGTAQGRDKELEV